MNHKAYRMIVFAVCLMSLALSMLACDGGNDNCIDGNGHYIPCSVNHNVYDTSDDPINQVKQAVQQVNQTVSDDATWWVNQHSAGSMNCLSVWDQNCK